MRIAYVCFRYPPHIGGIEKHVAALASRLARQGCEVDVVTCSAGGEPGRERIDGVEVRRFDGPLERSRYLPPLALWRHLRREGARWDLVHAHDYHALPALAAALSPARPLVFTPHYQGGGHSPASRVRNGVYRPFGRLVAERATRVICVSTAEAVLLARHLPSIAGRIRVVPNGVELPPEAPAMTSREPVIVSLGRLERYKRVDATVRAMESLPPGFRLRVVGDGPARAELDELVSNAGVEGRVEFLGRLDDGALRRVLAEGRVLATMSSAEAFGLAPVEAVAAGMRVVASDIPAHRELRDLYLKDWVTLVPEDAPPPALAAAIERSATESPPPPPTDLPTWDRVAEITLELYRSLLRG